MSRRSILILGGGIMQLPAIRAAGELGLRVWMADANAACPGRDRVDRFVHVDLRDRDGLLAAAREIPDLAAVFTAGTDFSTSVAWLTEHLGLPGVPYRVAQAATDKGIMRRQLAAAGVAVPRFRAFDADEGDEPILAAVDEIGLPLVVKPVDNMGARGVVSVASREELLQRAREARALSRSGRVVVESIIAGREYSLDALVVRGTAHVTGVAERHISFPPRFVEMGHTIPASLTRTELAALTAAFTGAIRALGISHGAAKGDVFLARHPDGTPYGIIGEVAARLSGGFMSGWTYPLSSGVDLTRHAIRVALGEPVGDEDLVPTRMRVVAERALVSAPGRIIAIEASAERVPGVAERFVNRKVGDRMVAPTNNVEKVANAIGVGATVEEAHSAATADLESILVRLDPADEETREFMFQDGWTGVTARYRLSGSAAQRLSDWSVPEPSHVVTDRPVAVLRPPFRLDAAQAAHPASPLAALVERMERAGEIRIVDRIEAGVHTGRFWRAMLAAGRQGAAFSVDVKRMEIHAR